MNDEARLLLSAYRTNGRDADDPVFAPALAEVERDPALAQWFAEQQEFDRAVAARLHEVEVPAELRARILAGAAVGRRPAWWAAPRLWALAAALALFAGLAAFWPGKTDGLADWQKHGLAVVSDLLAARQSFDLKDQDAEALRTWLRDHAVPQPVALPGTLGGKPTLGCKTIAWDGHKMSVVCFDLGGGLIVHLLTTERAGLANVPPDGGPRFAREGVWTVALWNEGDKTLMLASDQGEEPLRRLLQLAQRAARSDRFLAFAR